MRNLTSLNCLVPVSIRHRINDVLMKHDRTKAWFLREAVIRFLAELEAKPAPDVTPMPPIKYSTYGGIGHE